jgi:hypothetical protein
MAYLTSSYRSASVSSHSRGNRTASADRFPVFAFALSTVLLLMTFVAHANNHDAPAPEAVVSQTINQ